MLTLAAREADLVSIYCALPNGTFDEPSVADLTAARIAQKVDHVRSAATAAGRDVTELELQFSVHYCAVATSSGCWSRPASARARLFQSSMDSLRGSPAVLIGGVSECVDQLQEWRDRFGFSYLNLRPDLDAVAPIVARLAGT